MSPSRVYIGIGSNLGDRLATLRSAVRALAQLGRVAERSSVWETEAVGPPPDYYNAVIVLETDRAPEALLDALLAIEGNHGRVRASARDAPRTLDLDILLWDDLSLSTERLTVPHPRMHGRAVQTCCVRCSKTSPIGAHQRPCGVRGRHRRRCFCQGLGNAMGAF